MTPCLWKITMEDNFISNLPYAQLLLLIFPLCIMSFPCIQRAIAPLYHSNQDPMPSTNWLVWCSFLNIPLSTYKLLRLLSLPRVPFSCPQTHVSHLLMSSPQNQKDILDWTNLILATPLLHSMPCMFWSQLSAVHKCPAAVSSVRVGVKFYEKTEIDGVRLLNGGSVRVILPLWIHSSHSLSCSVPLGADVRRCQNSGCPAIWLPVGLANRRHLCRDGKVDESPGCFFSRPLTCLIWFW